MATAVLTPDLITALVAAVRAGTPPETATRAAGISHASLYEWLNVAESGFWHNGARATDGHRRLCIDLSDGLAAAKAQHEQEMLDAILEASRTVGKSGVREWRAGAWYLEHAPHTKQRWGQQVTIDQHVTLTPTQRQVRALSDAELEALASADSTTDQTPALPAPDAPGA